MVDIHCHILPGLDDGAKSMEESLQMAEMAIDDGITHVVATPHCNAAYRFDPELVRQCRDELQERVGDRLRLATGCDFHLSYENLQSIESHASQYTINQKSYLLVEFAEFAIPPNIDERLHQLQLMGLSPVITHPERNPLIRSQPERLQRWLQLGCYVQVTAQSLLGQFGETAQKQAERLLARDMVHFVASDAHNTTRRPLRLRQAYEAVAAQGGSELADALFRANPLAAFEGRPLPYEPEIQTGPAPAGRRKRFFFF
jgi:protein-tyrosine phosphatase